MVREVRVIRSVTICRHTYVVNETTPRRTRRTHPLIKGLTFPNENDITLDEVRIERLYEREDNVPESRRNGSEQIMRHVV